MEIKKETSSIKKTSKKPAASKTKSSNPTSKTSGKSKTPKKKTAAKSPAAKKSNTASTAKKAAPAKKTAAKAAAKAPVTKTETAAAAKKPPKTVVKKINILLAASEATPFASTGGLGEVASSLPKALNDDSSANIDCRVVMPLYQSVDQQYRDKMEFVGDTEVTLAWRKQYVGLFRLEINSTIYYFIDNEYYFNRDALYGYYDDCERFAFFSKAVFEAIDLMNFIPDIIHANDWQTALIPIFQNVIYHREFMKTIFTIHNVQYQGSYGTDVLNDVLGMPEDTYHIVEFEGNVNLMKGGIESANIVTTVSPSYAEELKLPENAYGLHNIIIRNQHKLRGILNGIDTEKYDPENDKYISHHYSASSISGKSEDKKALQQLAGLAVRDDVPLMAIISRLVDHKGTDLVIDSIDRLLDEDAQFIVLGTGDKKYEDFFKELAGRRPDRAAAFIQFSNELSHTVYAGADILLMPSKSEPCGLSQMIACRYGTVPVVRETGGLKDSIQDCTLGSGSGFVFRDYDPNTFYNVVKSAIDRYHERNNWDQLVKYDLGLDFSWKNSAQVYKAMYKELLQY